MKNKTWVQLLKAGDEVITCLDDGDIKRWDLNYVTRVTQKYLFVSGCSNIRFLRESENGQSNLQYYLHPYDETYKKKQSDRLDKRRIASWLNSNNNMKYSLKSLRQVEAILKADLEERDKTALYYE